ncbi:MAG: hypothetical protein NT045_02285, partial [Candidatus Aureabacteria bacterium]|nr:hypothetical protein [Candidatus Auribacterota bacterium]
YLRAAATPTQAVGAVYNVGSGAQTTIRQVVDVARRELDISATPSWESMPDRIWDTGTWVADNRLITAALGWKARGDFETGFRAMVDWFKENPDMLALYRERIHALGK